MFWIFPLWSLLLLNLPFPVLPEKSFQALQNKAGYIDVIFLLLLSIEFAQYLNLILLDCPTLFLHLSFSVWLRFTLYLEIWNPFKDILCIWTIHLPLVYLYLRNMKLYFCSTVLSILVCLGACSCASRPFRDLSFILLLLYTLVNYKNFSFASWPEDVDVLFNLFKYCIYSSSLC